MKHGPKLLLAMLVAVALPGCGGGGGGGAGGGVSISGTVSDIVVGIPDPVADVSVGAAATTTSTVDGSFTLTVPSGTTHLTVIRPGPPAVTFTFAIPAATSGETVGPLWIGPNQVSVTGTAVDSTTQAAIPGATVSIGGVSGTTAANGTFSLAGVAYGASSSFPSLPGTISATGYISANFEPGSVAESNGSVSVGQIALVAANSNTPPGGPYNIWGRVSPLKSSPGATVTLSLNGVPYRTATVGTAGTYYFWVSPGTYTINVSQAGFTAPTVTATLTSTNELLEEDVTLTGT